MHLGRVVKTSLLAERGNLHRGVQTSSLSFIAAPSPFLYKTIPLNINSNNNRINALSWNRRGRYLQGKAGVMNSFYYGSIDVPSTKEAEITDITDELESIISNESIEQGILTVQSSMFPCLLSNFELLSKDFPIRLLHHPHHEHASQCYFIPNIYCSAHNLWIDCQ